MERIGRWVLIAYRTNVPPSSESAAPTGSVAAMLRSKFSTLQMALLNGSLIWSRLQLCAAIHRLGLLKHLRTKSIGTELMVMLSHSRSISDALQQFASHDDAACTIVALYDPSPQDVAAALACVPKDSVVPLTALQKYADAQAIMKSYGVSESEEAACGLEACIVNRIAANDI